MWYMKLAFVSAYGVYRTLDLAMAAASKPASVRGGADMEHLNLEI
jgi:hypothetical protein